MDGVCMQYVYVGFCFVCPLVALFFHVPSSAFHASHASHAFHASHMHSMRPINARRASAQQFLDLCNLNGGELLLSILRFCKGRKDRCAAYQSCSAIRCSPVVNSAISRVTFSPDSTCPKHATAVRHMTVRLRPGTAIWMKRAAAAPGVLAQVKSVLLDEPYAGVLEGTRMHPAHYLCVHECLSLAHALAPNADVIDAGSLLTQRAASMLFTQSSEGLLPNVRFLSMIQIPEKFCFDHPTPAFASLESLVLDAEYWPQGPHKHVHLWLTKLPTLRTLFLHCYTCNDDGSHLLSALAQCTALTDLDLDVHHGFGLDLTPLRTLRLTRLALRASTLMGVHAMQLDSIECLELSDVCACDPHRVQVAAVSPPSPWTALTKLVLKGDLYERALRAMRLPKPSDPGLKVSRADMVWGDGIGECAVAVIPARHHMPELDAPLQVELEAEDPFQGHRLFFENCADYLQDSLAVLYLRSQAPVPTALSIDEAEGLSLLGPLRDALTKVSLWGLLTLTEDNMQSSVELPHVETLAMSEWRIEDVQAARMVLQRLPSLKQAEGVHADDVMKLAAASAKDVLVVAGSDTVDDNLGDGRWNVRFV